MRYVLVDYFLGKEKIKLRGTELLHTCYCAKYSPAVFDSPLDFLQQIPNHRSFQVRRFRVFPDAGGRSGKIRHIYPPLEYFILF